MYSIDPLLTGVIAMSLYSPAKVAQMAAFFAQKQGGRINVLKLTKLLYLADRVAIAGYGRPISYDRPVAMPHGPVLSRTLDLLNGFVGGPAAAQWEEWISARANYEVELKRQQLGRADLDELSDADLEVLELVWRDFGHMDHWTLSDWTHKNCSEWKDPRGSSLPIDEVSRLLAVGKDAEQAKELAAEIEADRELDAQFARL
jgi:uncharacterized phage-associated protein